MTQPNPPTHPPSHTEQTAAGESSKTGIQWLVGHPGWALWGSFIIRLGIGFIFYLVAVWLNPSEPLGLLNQWFSAPDASSYHSMALRALNYFLGVSPSIRLRLPLDHINYPLILGGLYYLGGPSPLWGILLNALAYWGIGWLAHRMALNLGHPPRRALFLALTVSLWPFSFAYSSTLLRDSLVLLALFGSLAFLCELLTNKPGRVKTPWSFLGLIFSVYLLVILRPEMAGLVVLALPAGMSWTFIARLIARTTLAPWRFFLAGLLVAAGTWSGLSLPPHRFVALSTNPSALYQGQSPEVDDQTPTSNQEPSEASSDKERVIPWQDNYMLNPAMERRLTYVAGGGLAMSPDAFLVPDGLSSYLTMVATGWRDLLLYPIPWQGPPSGGLLVRLLLTVLTLSWYGCLPGFIWGLVKACKNGSPYYALPVVWFVLVGTAMAFTVVNLGTLLRLRDIVLAPTFLLFDTQPYLWIERLLSKRGKKNANPGALIWP